MIDFLVAEMKKKYESNIENVVSEKSGFIFWGSMPHTPPPRFWYSVEDLFKLVKCPPGSGPTAVGAEATALSTLNLSFRECRFQPRGRRVPSCQNNGPEFS